MSLQNKFNFIGELQLPKDDAKFYKVYTPEDKSYEIHSVTFMIKETKNSGEWVELGGFKPGKVIKTIGEYNKETKSSPKLEFPKEKRFDEDVISQVARFKKTTINLLGETKEFITEYDAVVYLIDTLPKYKDKRLYVSGNIEVSMSNGKVYRKLVPTYVREAKEDEKNKLQASVELFYNKNSVDKTRLADEGIVDLFAYVDDYDRPSKSNKYFPMSVVLNVSGVNLENEKNKARLDHLVKYMTAPSEEYVSMKWLMKVFNGAEEVEFDESMLTDAQREEIALGFAELDDFKPSKDFMGQNKKEYRLIKPLLAGDKYKDGFFETGLDEDEFGKNIVKERVVDKKADAKVTDVVEDDTFDDSDEDSWL